MTHSRVGPLFEDSEVKKWVRMGYTPTHPDFWPYTQWRSPLQESGHQNVDYRVKMDVRSKYDIIFLNFISCLLFLSYFVFSYKKCISLKGKSEFGSKKVWKYSPSKVGVYEKNQRVTLSITNDIPDSKKFMYFSDFFISRSKLFQVTTRGPMPITHFRNIFESPLDLNFIVCSFSNLVKY